MRAIVLQDGAGSGKTSVLAAWQQALASLGFEVAWLSLSADDDEPARFIDYVLGSLARVDPAIVREAALLNGLGADRNAIERIVIALVHGLATHGRELVLVLDDLHLVRNPLILDGMLQFLIDYAPANFHLAIATRRPPPLALGRLHAQGQLLELGAADLRFTPAETEQYLRSQLGTVAARHAAHLHSLSDGWPAGLHLLAVNLRRGGAAPQRVPIHDAGSFAAYFEREVLVRLEASQVEGLVRLALCSRFCARLAAVLLADPQQSAAPVLAASLLVRLERESLFIMPLDSTDHERWYRLHPLLREVLQARVAALLPEDRQALHLRAAEWFEGEGLVEEAVRHRLDADQPEAAAALVERCAEDLQWRGDYRALAGILGRLPAQVIARHLRLRFLQAHLLLRTRQLDAHERALDALERDVPAGDALHRFMLVAARAGLFVQRDDTIAASALLPQLDRLPPQADGWTIGSQKNLLSLILLHEGRYEAARAAQEQDPPRLVKGEPLQGGTQGLLMGRCFVGLSHELEGNMLLAERQYRDVLRECGSARERAEPALLAAALLGHVLYEGGEVAAALDLLEDRVEVLERASIPDVVLRVLVVFARAHRLAGRQLECMAYLERLEDHAVSLRLDRLLAAALLEQLQERLRLLQFEQGDALLARLSELAGRYAAGRGMLGEISLIAALGHAQHALAHGEFESAGAQLRALLETARARGYWRRVARLQVRLAVLEQRCGRAATGRAAALEALRLGHRLGLLRSLLDAHPEPAAWLDAVRADVVVDPVLSFYVGRLLAAHQVRPAAAEPAAPQQGLLAEPLSQREADVLRMLALALPNKKIARSLGLSPETVKWHLRNIYRKLDVAGRDEAVARARDLGLDAT